MYLLFFPAVLGLVLIVALTLWEHFASEKHVPMLEQLAAIEMEDEAALRSL